MEIIIGILVVLNLYILINLNNEKKRLRVMTAFVAGLTKSIEDSGVEYKKILDNIVEQFNEDYWIDAHNDFIKSERGLFWEDKLANGGFPMMYLDFFDKQKEINEKFNK